MKVASPVGEYEYVVRKVTLSGGRLRVEGNLGVWQTIMEVEPADWLALARRAARPAVLLVAGVTLAGAVRRSRRS